MKNKNNAAVELGRLGGQKTRERYGKDYFKGMAIQREAKRREVLASVTVEEIQNPVTLKSVQEKLEQIDNEN